MSTKYDEDIFQNLLHLINIYTEIENLDGGPYKHIQRITKKKTNNHSTTFDSIYYNEYKLKNPDYPIKVNNFNVTVNTDILESQLKEFVPLTHYKNNSGEIISINSKEEITNEDIINKPWYKDKPAELQLNKYKLTKKIELEYGKNNDDKIKGTHINPELLQYIERQISNRANTIFKQRLFENMQKNYVSNYISM